MFDNLETDASIQGEKDIIGGFGVLESDLYDLTIKHAYYSYSAGEAMCVNIHFETENGQQLRSQFWATSAKAKGCKNYFIDKNGTKQYLPGFNQANALCLLTVGKELGPLTKNHTEDKVIKLYDFAERKEVPTPVKMYVDMIGKKITAGVIKQIVDKTEKDPDSGEYLPTGETRFVNEVGKFFRHRDGLTVPEILAKLKEPAFRDKWQTKWQGKTQDKSTDVSGTVAGPPKVKREVGKQAPQEKLFA